MSIEYSSDNNSSASETSSTVEKIPVIIMNKRFYIRKNSEKMSRKYPKVHPVTGERAIGRGTYWGDYKGHIILVESALRTIPGDVEGYLRFNRAGYRILFNNQFADDGYYWVQAEDPYAEYYKAETNFHGHIMYQVPIPM